MKKKNRINKICEIILWGVSIVIVYPLLMMILTSFKSKGESGYMSITLPSQWHFENYVTVMEEGFIRSLWNSISISGISVALIIFMSAFLGYVIVRRDTKVCRIAYKLLLMGIVSPFVAMPTMQLLRALGIHGSKAGLCLVYTALNMPLATMLFGGFIRGIPRELDEAAIMDGAIGGRLFIMVLLPLLKPVLATVGVLCFMGTWNELQIPLYLLNSSSKWTLPLSVYNFFGQYSKSWNLVSADIILASLPVIIVYALAQKWVIAGMTAGAVKG